MTRIELVSSGVVDLYDDLPISQTFSIYSIEDPNQRSGSWSKTITLPGTSNNNNLFKHIYEFDSYCNFNPLVKAKVLVYSDDILFTEGYMLLSNVKKKEDFIEYEVNIFSNNSNLFFDMGEGLMQDLDLSQYNEELTAVNIEASWTAPIGEGVVYPMIDYGFYLSGTGWLPKHFRPAVYIKSYIDAIFSKYGYTYTSSFFESDEFKRLIIPFSGGEFKLDEQTIYDEIIRSYVTTSQGFITKTPEEYSSNPYTSIIQFPNNTLDGLGQFDETTGIFTATRSRSLIVTVDNMAFVKPGGGFTDVQICVVTSLTKGFYVAKSIPIGITGNTGTQSVTLNVSAGTQIFVRAYKVSGSGTFTVNSGTFATDFVDPNISIGDLVEVNKFIPRKIKQKDFFMSIVKMFNLFIDTDKSNSRNLIISPRNDFYSSGVVVDWSKKVDYSQPIEIAPILGKLKGKYSYSYKRDRDWFNQRYQDKYDEAYGSKTWDLDNTITQGEEKLEVIFSPTPLLQHNGLYFPDISDTGQGTVSSTSNEYNIRILYFGGLQPASGGWNFNDTKRTSYPYCGHLDQPINPTRDLSFGVPKEVYYNPTTYTNGNLFNRFHKQSIVDISDKDARVITIYIRLKATDIAALDFRSIYYADGHYMRLLEVSDFDPDVSISKCTFMKLIIKDVAHSDSYTWSSTAVYGGSLQQFS